MGNHSSAGVWKRASAILLLGFLLFGISGGLTAQAQEDSGENRLNRAYLSRFGRDFTQVITAPSRWGRRDFLTLAAVTGSGLVLMALDHDIQEWVQGRRTASSDNASSFFTVFGDGLALVGLSAVIYTAGEIGHDDGLRKTALLSLESLATASLLVWSFKMMAGRARPYTGESGWSFHPFTLESSYWSLPSGHTAAAFSVAAILAMQSKGIFVDIAAYSLASLVGIARVHDNKHWLSDVFIGSALGYFVARKIFDLNRPGEKRALSLGFQFSGGQQALTLGIAF